MKATATAGTVVVTGLGMVTPLGSSPPEVLRRIQNGDGAAAQPPSFDVRPFHCPVCARVADVPLPAGPGDAKTLRLMNRDAHLALSAGLAALQDAALVPGSTYPSEEVGLFGTTGLAGIALDEVAPLIRNSAGADGTFDAGLFGTVALGKVRPLLSFKILSNMPVCFLSIFAGIRGPSAVYNPCEGQGAQALIRGIRAVASGEVSCALVGGTDVKTHELAFISLQEAGIFDSWRTCGAGCIPAEGAAFLVLEDEARARDRSARVYARISAWETLALGGDWAHGVAERRLFEELLVASPPGGVALVSAEEPGTNRFSNEAYALEDCGHPCLQSLAPKKYLGDLFAAAAAIQVSMAALLAERSGGGTRVVAHCSGHSDEKAAFLLEEGNVPATTRTRVRRSIPEPRRAVITGLGVVSPLGNGAEAFWEGLTAGRSGIGPVTLFDASAMSVRIAGEVHGLDREGLSDACPAVARERDRKVWLGLAAATEALNDAGVLPPEALSKAALIVGVSLEAFFLQDVSSVAKEEDLGAALARLVLANPPGGPGGRPLQTPLNRLATILADRYGFGASRITECSACAAGAQAIGEALQMIQGGQCDLVLAGAADCMVNPLGLGGFALLKALSEENGEPERACRPFDATRRGTVLGEGAAFLVVESLESARARGARIYAELLGFGASLDAYRVSDPEPRGAGAALAMRRALAHAGTGPDGVDCVNAHGTGTPKNDSTETLAIKEVLGKRAYRVPVHAVKSMTGHLIAASGAVESVASVLTLHRGLIPPTINLRDRDPECDLDYVTEGAKPFSGHTVLSNSFGFGGQNAALLFGKAPV